MEIKRNFRQLATLTRILPFKGQAKAQTSQTFEKRLS